MESSTTTMRRPCFTGEDDGLASIAEFSGNSNNINNINNNNNGYYFVNQQQHHHQIHQNQPYMMRRRNSLRNISSLSATSSSLYTTTATVVSSPRSARLFDPRFEEVHSPHFLESCALCKKPLGGNRDIFMYRGDTPFCSEECRQEQIEIDEAKEKNWNMKSLRTKKESNKKATSSQNYPLRTGTVAAA